MNTPTPPPRTREVLPLTDGWTLRHGPDALPAQVPGCVHTDLLAAGRIPDPFLGRNELDVRWVGETDWRYDTVVDAPDSGYERAELVFEGLDTVAEVLLDGNVLGRTANMHRTYRFDVSDRLAAGGSAQLSVRFTDAYTAARQARERMGVTAEAYPNPASMIRKMACSFGWDWGPTLATAGIWRPVSLERWSTARLGRVRPLVTVHGTTGRVEAHLDVERTATGAGRTLTAQLRVGDRTVTVPFDGDGATITAEVPDARLWWPRGHGQQPLYDCEITLSDSDGTVLDTWSRRIGFRTVVLDTSPDEHGTGFTFVVNGRRIFARGVNWIPDDVFPSRVTPERYRRRLEQTAEAGCDMVRVWGGGLFESDDFYDVCDELGLMVWQDFLFACAPYPEGQPLRSEVEAEARENVVRLMPHASLVLWNGNNENLWTYLLWNWEEQLRGESWGEGYYLALLPRVVAETDPTRPYWAGSPWSGSWDHHPDDPAHGCFHSWEVWNTSDYTDYLDSVPRFVAEFGWQAPCAWATLRRALPGEELRSDAPGFRHHQKADDGTGKLERGLARHFAVPEDFDTWHYLTQVNQVRAVATGVTHWRSHWPVCAGALVWQINDCWPVSSWAAVDGDERRKPLWYALRELYADRLLTVQLRSGEPALCAVNQSAEPWRAQVRLRRLDTGGRVLAERTLTLDADPDSVATVAVPEELRPAEGARDEYLVADVDGLRAVHFPVRDLEFAYPEPEFEVSVRQAEAGDAEQAVTVTVTARTLLRDLLLQADRLAPTAEADRGLLTLLPGESAAIRVTGWDGADAEAARAALFVVRTAA
ncbi:glycoside hydrolase family 2 protein [Streptomyces sp. J2-1]|uniref:glycoside hydrolase family 2 protein n=1 Tax=Streptomyces corallincola TaxID=2851888 RepID=UPI001C392624|nr:glycoside hydrolase family 2 protein [Streptomyces corallincola]MBV2355405.1 glycoside hydrolase family 2 protein [Streptomyces corallincola]